MTAQRVCSRSDTGTSTHIIPPHPAVQPKRKRALTNSSEQGGVTPQKSKEYPLTPSPELNVLGLEPHVSNSPNSASNETSDEAPCSIGPKLSLTFGIVVLLSQLKSPRLYGLQELPRSAPNSHHTLEAMKRMRVGILTEYPTLHSIANPLPEARESDTLVSSDEEPDTLTAQQINYEVSE